MDKRGLVVMGSQDHIFFGSAAEKFARAQKNMRLAVIENCGHVCSIEAPELFNDLVLKFLVWPRGAVKSDGQSEFLPAGLSSRP